MIIVPFSSEHFHGIDWQELTEGSWLAPLGEKRLNFMLQEAETSWAFTGIEVAQESSPCAGPRPVSQVVFAAGLWLLWPGVAEAWALFTPAVRELTWQVVKAIKKGLEDLTVGLKLHRIQAEVRAEFVPGQKLMRVLGFNQEGPPMRKYGPDGADYLRYVRIRD